MHYILFGMQSKITVNQQEEGDNFQSALAAFLNSSALLFVVTFYWLHIYLN